jgi:catechol 2,3-dioxygenase-like lactoylglutathione lyase family enzyme
MAESSKPHIDCEQIHPVLAADDVAAATAFYRDKLGFLVAFTYGDPPTMSGVNIGNVQMFLEKGPPKPEGASVYFMVGNADELFAFHKANGVEVVIEPGDREYALRDYSVRDLNGYELSFGHPLFNAGDPIMIERVDVPVRLEKRLAALLNDLAEYKRMSLSSLLEEILLHTNEPYGEGVASPHTKGQLKHIQRLKKKHGIDYDSHGSYRFREK